MLRNALVLALVLVAASAAAQERFINRTLNFSILTPAADWHWSALGDKERGDSAGVWMVTGPRGERFAVSVSPAGHFTLDESWIYELQRSLRRDGAQHGYRVEDFRYTRSTSPIFPSYTFSYTRVVGDKKDALVDGYLTTLNRVYTIQYASSSRGAINEFRRFVDSFQIADKFEAQRGGGTTAFPGIAALGLQTIFGVEMAPNGRSGGQ